MPENKSLPPTFAIQKAGGGKAKILAIHQRRGELNNLEAVAVTTVSDVELAKKIVRGLALAWEHNPYAEAGLVGMLETLPQAVATAIEGAMAGRDSVQDADGLSLERRDVEIACRFAFTDSPLTPRQAVGLHTQLAVFSEEALEALNRDGDLVLDGDVLEVIGDQPEDWWVALSDGCADMAYEMLAGNDPAPRTFGEAVMLWSALDSTEEGVFDLSEDAGGWGDLALIALKQEELGYSDADEDWVSPRKRLLKRVDPIAEDCASLAHFAQLCPPEKWHELLPDREPRDPARLL